MRTFRAHWMDPDWDEDGRAVAPALHVVSGTPPPRPHWSHLYVVAHFGIHDHALLTLADAGFSAVLFTILAGWIQLNRVALSRVDEPDAGLGRPRVRVVRPGVRARRGELSALARRRN
jgi:hypothetical protein